MEEIRTFVAVELSDDLKHELRGAQKQLKSAPGAFTVRWVEPDNMHLTLKFLGNVPRSRVEELGDALAPISELAPFSLNAEGLGCFPSVRRPNVVWVGLGGPVDRIEALARQVDDVLAAKGIEREARPFSPHLTLGRVNRDARPADRAMLGDAIQKFPRVVYGAVPVDAVHLIQSDLRPGGPVYTILRTVRLGASGPP